MMRRLGLLALALALAAPSLAPAQTLDLGEEKHLVFMREEEKLARDVYLTFAKRYPRTPIFLNIATQSEQTHTDQVEALLAAYGLPDPSTSDTIGVFTGPDFGWYFTEKFNQLVAAGQGKVLDALYVGAFIEELDMLDIVDCPKVIVQSGLGIAEGACGLSWTDEPRIQTVLGNLLEASKNHLRSYVSNIERFIGAGNYVAQVLSQEEVDAILGR